MDPFTFMSRNAVSLKDIAAAARQTGFEVIEGRTPGQRECVTVHFSRNERWHWKTTSLEDFELVTEEPEQLAFIKRYAPRAAFGVEVTNMPERAARLLRWLLEKHDGVLLCGWVSEPFGASEVDTFVGLMRTGTAG